MLVIIAVDDDIKREEEERERIYDTIRERFLLN